MKHQKIIPVITLIIGGCIGIKCGGKLVLYAQKQYAESDEFKKNIEKRLKIRLDDYAWEIEKES